MSCLSTRIQQVTFTTIVETTIVKGSVIKNGGIVTDLRMRGHKKCEVEVDYDLYTIIDLKEGDTVKFMSAALNKQIDADIRTRIAKIYFEEH